METFLKLALNIYCKNKGSEVFHNPSQLLKRIRLIKIRKVQDYDENFCVYKSEDNGTQLKFNDQLNKTEEDRISKQLESRNDFFLNFN